MRQPRERTLHRASIRSYTRTDKRSTAVAADGGRGDAIPAEEFPMRRVESTKPTRLAAVGGGSGDGLPAEFGRLRIDLVRGRRRIGSGPAGAADSDATRVAVNVAQNG